MTPELRNSAAHVFVTDIANPELTEADSHHLTRVLRIKSDELVTVCDGNGSWRTAILREGAVVPVGEISTQPVGLSARLAFVPVKGDRTELIVQKATEIGVSEIVVIAPTARSVVKWDEKKSRNEIERLTRISREAAMQSRRLFLPRITGMLTLREVAESGFVVAEPGGNAAGTQTAIAVGPEGGFAPEEVALFSGSVDLGNTILRAETAAIVAALRAVDAATVGG